MKRRPDLDSAGHTAYEWRVVSLNRPDKAVRQVLALRDDGGIVPLDPRSPGFWFTTAACVLRNHLRATGERPERLDVQTRQLPEPGAQPAEPPVTPQASQGLGTLGERADRARRAQGQ